MKKAKVRKIKSKSDIAFDAVIKILLGFFGFLCVYPLWYILILSFNDGVDTMRGGIYFWPRQFTLANYIVCLRDNIILGAYVNTILRTVLGTVAGVAVTGMVAYGVSERNLPGRKFIMIYMMIPMLFSAGLIPTYLNLKSLGLINRFGVYIFPAVFSIWNCIIMRTSFEGIPTELKESMRIDGANELQILMRLILPISKPILAAIALFTAVGHWNDWFTGAYYVTNSKLVPIQTYLQSVMNRSLTNFEQGSVNLMGLDFGSLANANSMSIKLAVVVLSTVPILMIYPFLQKYFIKGVMVGSVKG
ncbi:MAG: hypothetical protein RHS_5364 [Robinsoniella sp. RHS]|uniref:carbohydrate ABC transporter permease n=1 Tax=Robinsoniella TaxID=588605 RepID=UPI0006598A77|nr:MULTISPECIES: carbohydrate ABC transporter permease [Robinsoniella]KLU68799.1 MAG: hypothetical protein RHS_5364 [Robinsoniella sp. RHS]